MGNLEQKMLQNTFINRGNGKIVNFRTILVGKQFFTFLFAIFLTQTNKKKRSNSPSSTEKEEFTRRIR